MAQCHVPKRGISEVRAPVVRTNCDEIDSMAEIILRSEADIFPGEWHAQESSKKRCRASRKIAETQKTQKPGPTKTITRCRAGPAGIRVARAWRPDGAGAGPPR